MPKKGKVMLKKISLLCLIFIITNGYCEKVAKVAKPAKTAKSVKVIIAEYTNMIGKKATCFVIDKYKKSIRSKSDFRNKVNLRLKEVYPIELEKAQNEIIELNKIKEKNAEQLRKYSIATYKLLVLKKLIKDNNAEIKKAESGGLSEVQSIALNHILAIQQTSLKKVKEQYGVADKKDFEKQVSYEFTKDLISENIKIAKELKSLKEEDKTKTNKKYLILKAKQTMIEKLVKAYQK